MLALSFPPNRCILPSLPQIAFISTIRSRWNEERLDEISAHGHCKERMDANEKGRKEWLVVYMLNSVDRCMDSIHTTHQHI